MPTIEFFNASSGESKKLDLKDLKKEDAFKAFKEVMTKKENKETPTSLKALFGDQIEFKKSSLFDNDNKKGDLKK